MTKLLADGLRSYVVSRVIYGVGIQLSFVFVPLLLLNQGFVLWQVWAFNAATDLIGLLTVYPCLRYVNKFGVRKGFILGTAGMAAYLVVLTTYVGTGSVWAIAALLVVYALASNIILHASNFHIAYAMETTRKGRDHAAIELAFRAAGSIAPLLGGVIAATAGPAWMTAVSATLLLASLPVLLSSSHVGRIHQSEPELRYHRPPPWRDLLAMACYNGAGAINYLTWPIYLAVIVTGFKTIGAIMTVASVAILPLLAVVAWLVDNGRHQRALIGAIVCIALINCLRLITDHPVWLTLVAAMVMLAGGALGVTWGSSYRHWVRSLGPVYLLWTQSASWIGSLVINAVLAVIAYASQGTHLVFAIAFPLAAVVLSGCLLIRRVS